MRLAATLDNKRLNALLVEVFDENCGCSRTSVV